MKTSIGAAAVATAIAMAIAAPPAGAQTKTGTTIGAFLLIEPSARMTALGNAGSTREDGLDAVYYNPAAIGRIERYGVLFSHSAWLADIGLEYVAVGIPMGSWGNAYASVTSLNSGDIDVRTVAQPGGTGERFQVSDIALSLGYGRAITDRFAVGVQVNYAQETIWHSSMSAATVSLGTLYRTSERGLRLGASLSNFGTHGRFSGSDLRITYDVDPNVSGDNGALPGEAFTDPYAVPVVFRAGLGLPVRLGDSGLLDLVVDAFHPNDNTESLGAGAEYRYRNLLALRLGWQDAFQQDAETGLTAGGGLGGKLDVYSYRLDYAWADHGRLGGTHRVSFGLEF
jgi:hypothetical protein